MPFSHTRVLLFLRTLDKLSVCLLPPLFRSLSILSRLLCFHIIFIVSTIILIVIDDEVELHHSCPRNRMSVEILGTNCDQCWSTVRCCFTSTETVRLVRTESPGWPHQRSHGSWTLVSKSAESLLSPTHRVTYPACPPTRTQTLWNSRLLRLFPHHLEEEDEEEEADADMLATEKLTHTQLLLLLS